MIGKNRRARLASRYGFYSIIGAAVLIAAFAARAQPPNGAGAEEEDAPPTSIQPAPETGEAPNEPAAPAVPVPAATAPPSGARAPRPAATSPHYHHLTKFELQPARAKVRVVRTGWIYASPATDDRRLERVQPGTVVSVTGVTRRWLRLKLHDGSTGYIEQSSVDLVKPTDKIFVLTRNSAVLAAPNRWASKVAEVHKGHDAHVVGVALDYFKIRMSSGLEGYVGVTAFE